MTLTADTLHARVAHLLAAFPEGSDPRLKAVSFGIDYDPARFGIIDWGACADFELADSGWPGPGAGTAMSWGVPQSTLLTEVYWFAGYSYTAASHSLSVVAHPRQGGVFVDDSIPPVVDPVEDYGRLGFNTFGYRPGTQETQAEPHQLSVYLSAELVHPDHEDAAARPIEGMAISPSALLDTLYACGATSIRKSFPGTTPADTLAYDLWGDPVVLPDLSYYFRLTFPTEEAARQAEAALWACPGVGHAEFVPDTTILYGEPDDSWFQDHSGYAPDPQWYLKNDGLRSGSFHCGDAVERMDTRVSDLPYWYLGEGNPSVVVAIVDGGVNSQHEDLREVVQFGPHAQNEIDYCGNHGHKMAGIAAALTNNDGVGVAGVCPNCSIADVALVREDIDNCTHQDEYVYSISTAPYYIYQATDWSRSNLEYEIGAFNISVGIQPWRECTDVLWRGYLQEGILPCAATGNRGKFARYENWRPALPFVLGVGGHTWTGEFWDWATTCYAPAEVNGDTLGTLLGELNIDVCAPASGSNWTVYPVAVNGYPYAYTRMMTSGAAATASGAVGLLRSYWKDAYPEMNPPRPGYLMGFLTGSALDFPVDPTSYPDRRCHDCPRADYGPGRLNLAGAVKLMEIYRDPAPGRQLVTNTLDWDDAESFIPERTFTYLDTMVRVTRVTWEVTIPPTPPELVGILPPYVAFLVPEDCRMHTGLAAAGELSDNGSVQWMAMNLHQARSGIYGGRLSPIDAQGGAEIWGRTYSFSVDGGVNWQPLGTTLDQIRAVCVTLGPMEFPAGAPRDRERGGLSLRIAGPSSPPVRVQLTGARGPGMIEVLDVSGRMVWSAELQPKQTVLTWPGTDRVGNKMPAGVYFSRARVGSETASAKIVLCR